MQKIIGKRQLSLLLAFAMLLSLLAVNQTITAYGLVNTTVEDALAAKGLPSSDPALQYLDLSGTEIVGEVDIDALKVEFPLLEFIDLSHTNVVDVSNISHVGTVNYNVNDTIFNGDRMLEFDGTPVEFFKSQPEDVTVGDILEHIQIRDAQSNIVSVDPAALSGAVRIEFYDSTNTTPMGFSNVTITNFTAADLDTVFFTAGAGMALRVEEAYTFEVTLDYRYASVQSAAMEIDLTVMDESLHIVSSTLNPGSPDYGYITEQVSLLIEKRDEYGSKVNITDESDFIAMVLDGGYASVTPVELSATQDGLLAVEFTTSGWTAGAWNILVMDLAGTAELDYDFDMRTFGTVYIAELWEYNVDNPPETRLEDSNTTNPETLSLFIRQGSAISSAIIGNVAEGTGTYSRPTQYLVRGDGNRLTPDLAGMIDVDDSLINGEIVVNITKQEIGGVEYLALEFLATNLSAVGDDYDITIHIDDQNGTVLDIPINCTVVPGDVREYTIFQVPSYFDGTVDLEAIINSSAPEDQGVYAISHSTKNSSGVFEQDREDQAEIIEDTSTYLVAAAVFGAGGNHSILPESSITKWYDYFDSTLTGFGPALTSFASNSNFRGAAVTSWHTAAAELYAADSQAVNPDGRIGLVIFDGAQNTTMTASVTTLERDFVGYIFVDGDYADGDPLSSTTVYSDGDAIPIGLEKSYRILRLYDNGNTDLLNLSDFTNSPQLTNNDSSGNTYFTLSEGPGGEVVLQATDLGGINDQLVGRASTVTIIDQDGVAGKLEVELDKSVITGFTYYIEPPEVKTLDVDAAGTVTVGSTSIGLVSETENASTIVKLPKGSKVQIYLVPEFSNTDKNNDITSGSGWQAYKAYPEDFDYVGYNESRPDNWDPTILEMNPSTTYVMNSTSDSAEIGIFNEYEFVNETIPDVGDDVRVEITSAGEIRLASEVALNPVADGYRTYDRTSGQFGVNLEAAARFVVAEAYVTAMDAEWYTDGTKNYKTYHSLSGNANEISGATNAAGLTSPAVGNEIMLRVKIAYSDGEDLDRATGRSTMFNIRDPHPLVGVGLSSDEVWVDEINPPILNSFSDGLFFMANSVTGSAPDYGMGYDPLEGPVAPGAIGYSIYNILTTATTNRWYYMPDLARAEPLDVLRAYYVSTETNGYLNYIYYNPDSLPTSGRGSLEVFDYARQSTAHSTVMAEMNKIKYYVLDAAGNDVAAAMNAGWSQDYPGIFLLTPHQVGSYQIIFYQDYELEDGTVVKVPMDELEYVSGDIYTITLGALNRISTEAEEIILVGDNIYFDDTATDADGNGTGEYVLDTGLPGTFYIYPVIRDNSFAGLSTTGLLKGDIPDRPGLEYMYADDFPGFDTGNLVVSTDSSGVGGRGNDSSIQFALETQQVDGKDVIAIKVTAAGTYKGVVDVSWNDLNYSGGAGYIHYDTSDSGNVLATNVAGSAKLYYRVDTLNLVYDISIGNSLTGTDFTVYRDGGSQLIAGDASDPALLGETLRIEVGYQLNNGFRQLFTDELAYVNTPGAGLPVNALLVMPDSANPGVCTVTGSSGSVSELSFLATYPGTYRFTLSTVNRQGAAVPQHQGTRTIEFTVDAQMPDYTITYGDVEPINWSITSLIPTYTIVTETPAGLLDSTALASGLLRMTANEAGTAVIEVTDDTGVSWGTFHVTMLEDTSGSSQLVPASASMGDGDTLTVREKTLYPNGNVEYSETVNAVFGTGTTTSGFLDHQGGGLLAVDNSTAGAITGSVNYYDVDVASGNTYHGVGNGFKATYAGSAPVLAYPEFEFGMNQLVLMVGETQPVVISSANYPGFNNDEHLFLRYGGNAASVSVTQNNLPGLLSITGIAPGTATITAANGAGTVGPDAQLEVLVLAPLSFTAHPQDVTVAAGGTASFTVAATGGQGTVNYQWQASSDGVTWQDMSVANAPAMSISNVLASMDGFRYRCLAEDGTGTVIVSREAVLSVTSTQPGYPVKVTVEDTSNVPVSGATVSLENSTGIIVATGSTDGSGEYEFSDIPDGNYKVKASANLFVPGEAPAVVNGAGTAVTVTLTSMGSSTHTISGSIIDSASTGIGGATVILLDGSGVEIDRTTSASATGGYGFANVYDGDYVILASAPLYAANTAVVPVQGVDCTGVDITLQNDPGNTGGHTVYGKVTDGISGLAGATVELILAGNTEDSVTTDSAGWYAFAGVAAGTYDVQASLTNYTSNSVANVPVAADTLVSEIVLTAVPAATHSISGTVTDDAATPNLLTGATLDVYHAQTGTLAGTATTSAGVYTVTGLPAGSYAVIATAANHQPQIKAVKIENSNVTDADFALKADPTVTGDAIVYGQVTNSSTPPAALGNATVTLKFGSVAAATATTGSDGYYITYDVPARTYDITASRSNYNDKTESVIVNAGDTVVRHDLQLTASTPPPGGPSGGSGGGTSYTAEITLDPTTIAMGEEATAEVARLLSGSNAVTITGNARFTWTVSDETVAAVASEDGKTITLEGLSAGTATIRVSVVNSGQTYTGSATLTVRGEEEFAAGDGFTDVPASFWGYDAITYLAEHGIVSGYEDGTFLPNNAILRNEFAVMLSNSKQWGTATSAQMEAAAAHFADWSEIPAWAQNAWALAYANNVMEGNLNGSAYYAEGGRNISRQEVSVVFGKLLGTGATTEVGFRDAGEIASWALDAVQECVAEGLISGYEDNSFRPTANITRAESATIFYQYLTR